MIVFIINGIVINLQKCLQIGHFKYRVILPSEQFLASIKLASNKAICLKTKKINKSNMYF